MYNKLAIPVLALLLFSCDSGYTPKPAGYVRIKTPDKVYQVHDQQEFYSFEIPEYATIKRKRSAQPGWIDVAFPELNGTVHLSYKPVNDNLGDYIADCRTLAYKHTVKAEGIEETPFIQREENRFGMIYDLEGDVASAVQFFITDSTTHFLRGSLYFNCTPNQDSLKPLVDFIREDILHLIATTEWKYE
jgi:gliding motility-associated lipoprotein GldD